ncbi:MAG: ADOP family duplicated permease [Vicinamibacterales bacterium]
MQSLLLEDFRHDLLTSVRSLIRVPALSLTIILTVGVGIGATAAIVRAIDAAFLQPLPYTHPERLVRVYTDAPPFEWRFSAADYLAFREQQTHFEESATFTDRTVTYSDGVSSEVLRARVVSWTFFSLLGISPALGRDFTERDGLPDTPPAAIASHAFWRDRLGGRSDAIGGPIQLDGTNVALVGVLPPLSGPLERRQDIFLIQQFSPPQRRGPFLYTVVARLREDVSRPAAESELRAINKRIFPLWTASYQDDKATWSMEDLQTAIVGDAKEIAGVALASVALLWLVACANASNLLIARVASRRQELAVRSSLGASRARIARHLFAESALVAAVAAALGGGVAWAGIRFLHGFGSNYFPRMQEARFDERVFLLLAGLGLCSALIFGLVPALNGSSLSSLRSLQSQDRWATPGLATRRARRLLVGAQFAIVTPLLVVAALLLTSLYELRSVDLGFDQHNLITGSIRLPAAQYRDESTARVFWDELERRLAAVPGVTAIAFSDGLPPDGVWNINNFDLEDSPTPPGQSQPATPWVAVSPGYFRVLGLELLEGRLLEERDALPRDLLAVVVDRAWARRFFPGQSAVGRRFREGGCTSCPWTTVVGVVTEVKYVGLDQPDDGTLYWLIPQGGLARFLMARTAPDAAALAPALQRAVRGLDPSVPLSNVLTMEELASRSMERPQSLSLLVAVFGFVALALSVIGIYGVMSFYVQQHRRDIGIRMALGGTSSDVLRLVMASGMRVVIAGVLVGLLAALQSARVVSSLLFGVGAADLAVYMAVIATLTGVALVACYLPARRAAFAEPAAVLME